MGGPCSFFMVEKLLLVGVMGVLPKGGLLQSAVQMGVSP